jgi:methylmalonyl-CoA epimerase
MEMKFTKVNQVGIVVRDLERTAKFLQEKFGVGPFATLEHQLPKGRIKIGLTFLENLQLELIEVLEGEAVYSKFLEEKGEGIHHLGFFVKDIEEAKMWAEERGMKVLEEGNVAGVRYAYLDTEDDAGFILEFIQV